MKDLAGKVAVITGAGSGFGREFARIGAREGMRLVLADVQQDALDEAVAEARAAGLVSAPLMSVYNVSKHAVVTLSETLFHDLRLAKAKMGVSVLCPAFRNSERNRPAELTHDAPPTPSQIAARERTEKAIASGRLGAAEVARMTFDAVRNDRFYVITHAKMLASVELRFQDLHAQRNPSDPYTFKPEVAVRPR